MTNVFAGRELAALWVAINRLSKITHRSEETIIEDIKKVLGPTMVQQDIDAKNYSLCNYLEIVQKRDPSLPDGVHDPNVKTIGHAFLVPATTKRLAQEQAVLYLSEKGVTAKSTEIDVYSRNYKEAAQELFDLGFYYGATVKK